MQFRDIIIRLLISKRCFMRFSGLLIVLLLSAVLVSAQETAPTPTPDPLAATIVEPPTDRESLDAAVAIVGAGERAVALETFLKSYPESELKVRAGELLASARAAMADEALRQGNAAEGVELFKRAVREAPDPISEALFTAVLMRIPTNLYLLNQREAAFDVAELLEARSEGDSKRLVAVASFYNSIKYATGARRLSEKAVAADPQNAFAYQSLGVAHRLGFDLAGAAVDYANALELSPKSVAIMSNLAELKRALGEYSEAEKLYDAILEIEPENGAAKAGRIATLFSLGRSDEAEGYLNKELLDESENSIALIYAAQYYIANGKPDLALRYANPVIEKDPKALWAYLAAARALMQKGEPASAEELLVKAAQSASSSVLVYELSLVKMKMGLFREAAELIKTAFYFENGKIVTDLDGRIGAEADTFKDLVALERKSAISVVEDGYSLEEDADLKSLLAFETSVSAEAPDKEAVESSARAFAGREGEFGSIRKIYAASRMLDSSVGTETASELTKEAIPGIDAALNSKYGVVSILADELFQSRRSANAEGKILFTPTVSKQRLDSLLRGKVEVLAGRARIAEGNNAEAKIRLKRAASVLPKDSYLWSETMWTLGTLYQNENAEKDALDYYASSIANSPATSERKELVESLYFKVFGETTGYGAFIAKKREADPSAFPVDMFLKNPSKVDGIQTVSETPKESVGETTPAPKPLVEDVNLTLASLVKPETDASKEPATSTNTDTNSIDPKTVAEKTATPTETSTDTETPKEVETVEADTKSAETSAPATTEVPKDPETTEVSTDDPKSPAENTDVTTTNTTGSSTNETTETPKSETNVIPTADTAVSPEPTPAEVDSKTTDASVIPVDSEESNEPPTTDTATEVPAPSPSPETVVGDSTEKPIDSDITVETQDSSVPDPSEEIVETVSDTEDPVDDTPAKVDPPQTDEVVTEPTDVSKENIPENSTTPTKPEVIDVSTEPTTTSTDNSSTENPEKPVVDSVTADPKTNNETTTNELPTPAETVVSDSVEIKPESTTSTTNNPQEKDLIDLGAHRPRFVPLDKIRPAQTDAIEPCSFVVSQENVSIVANGGSFGIIVGLKNYGKPYVMRASSSSQNDVQIKYEPEIGSLDGRAFFVIRSVSENKGNFEVYFESPCGRFKVDVTVN
ncbi:MAG: tetratricopeptide repeat protein [Pyrinomonadaceae bacterium]